MPETSSIHAFFSDLPAFSALPPKVLKELCAQISEVTFEKGTVLAVQSKTAIDKVLVILRGALELYFEIEGHKSIRGVLDRGDIFGGVSILVNNGVAVRNVRAREDLTAYAIPEKVFIDLCKRYDAFHNYFAEAFHTAMRDSAYAAFFQQGQVIHFLSGTLPFSFLPEEELKTIAGQLKIEKYVKGTLLFVQGRSRVDRLYIVQKGAAERYYEEGGEKMLRGQMGPGDTYGGISMLINEGLSVRTVLVSEETTFLTLEKEAFLRLCRTYGNFSEYFTDTFGKRMVDRSYAAIIKRDAQGRADAGHFFNLRIENIYHSKILSCQADATIREAAQTMSRFGCSSILVKTGDGIYTGVVTDTDLRKKVIARGFDTNRPVSDIMSSPLHGINKDAMVSEALLEMMDTGVKHLAVTDTGGKVVGIVTNSDILSAQEQSPFYIIQEIASAEMVEEILHTHRRLPRLVQNMLNSGARSKTTARLISKISDAILKKLIGFALDRLGPPPTDFVFLVLGSEGRMEQTLKTDQDNAIIFADVPESDFEQVKIYFLKLGIQVCAWLDEAGYTFCKGNVMAQNPKWCQPLSKWKTFFKSWIRVSTGEDLMEAAIFFDFRGAYGNMAMADELRAYLFDALSGWTRFYRDLAASALGFKPPIGLFRNLVLESKGPHPNTFDIKKAMTPVVDAARIYALHHNIDETNTQERLYHLHLKDVIKASVYDELDQAYNYLMRQRLLCQIDSIEKGESPHNHLNPKTLSRIEQTMLKEIFKRIEGIQNKMNMDFTGGM